MPGRHRHPRPRNAGRRRPQVDPADHRRCRRRQSHDRLLACRGGRRADRRRARARRRGHLAQAGHRPLQWQIFRSAAEQAQGAWLCAGPEPLPSVAVEGSRLRRCCGRCRRPDRRLAIGASTGGIHALGEPVPGAAETRSACRSWSPSTFRSIHDRVRPPARRDRAARGGGRRGRHGAGAGPHPRSRPATRI